MRKLVLPLFVFALTVFLGCVSPLIPPAVEGAAPSSIFRPQAVYSPLLQTADTYYVRSDGGSAEECSGLADAPYPGSGMNQPCAWNHPFQALPPDAPARIGGGDTLILASGSYMMGYGAPGADNCDYAGSYGCLMSAVPSGPDSDHPTRILGAGWDSGCAAPPELWGSGRPWFVFNLTDTSNVEVACLEISDHSDCVEGHTGGLACERDTPPYGPWAAYGLYAEDSANVYLHHLDIHGLASGGVHAGRLTDWTVEDVRIAGNGSVGWDGDLWEGSDSNSGTLTFRRFIVEWNGCGETYPDGDPIGCWGQEAGGYGDGIGTGETGGNWIFEDSAILHNTSDGLDLLYHTLGGSISLYRLRAEGNAGNQVKVAGPSTIVNSVLVGNCAFFEGQPFTYWVDHCRALGSTLVLAYTGGDQVSIVNSTFYGQGDGLVGAGPRQGYLCDGSETLIGRNNILHGDVDYFDPGDITFFFYQEGCAGLKFDSNYNIAYQTKNITCGANDAYVNSGPNDLCQDPRLTGPLSGEEFGMTLRPDSPAIDAGLSSVAPPDDFDGRARDAHPDIGAYEYGASATLTPTVTPTSGPTPTPTPSPTPTPTNTPGGATTTPTPTATPTLAPDPGYTFSLAWGIQGSGEGQFDYPAGVAYGASLYVADFYNARVQHFTNEGIFLSEWGNYGSGNGEFMQPVDVAVAPDGTVYVLEMDGARVQHFTSAGVYIEKWGSFGSGEGRFQNAVGIAVDASGNVYVADSGNHRVQKFDAHGAFLLSWGSQGDGNDQFESPAGIAISFSPQKGSGWVSGGSIVYILDQQLNRVQSFSPNGVYQGQWGSGGSRVGQFNGAYGLAVDVSGNVFVADTGNQRLQKFTPSGVWLAAWGSPGSGNGQFDDPYDVALGSSGEVYVSDANNYRLQKFVPSAALLGKSLFLPLIRR